MAKTPIVQFVMGRSTQSFRADDPMREAMHRLAGSPFPALPVLDDLDHVIGVLSEKDCLRTVSHWAYDGVSGGTVDDHMSDLDVRITPDMDLLTAARAFLETNFSCLPVTENDRLVGFVHRHDVLKGIDRWATAIDRERELKLTTTSRHDRPSAIQHMQEVAATHSREQMSQVFKKH
ncbi:MAG: CBS domain-containing protein [Thermoanaerobaculales bacterium]|jgi:CBS domain-containing protein|nr:CBS domain-containing protein [Thermoanaerobaculales bacterium]